MKNLQFHPCSVYFHISPLGFPFVIFRIHIYFRAWKSSHNYSTKMKYVYQYWGRIHIILTHPGIYHIISPQNFKWTLAATTLRLDFVKPLVARVKSRISDSMLLSSSLKCCQARAMCSSWTQQGQLSLGSKRIRKGKEMCKYVLGGWTNFYGSGWK